MATQVYDQSSGEARFTISGNYVYPVGGGQPSYSINGDYWYDPSTGTTKFCVKNGAVYPYPELGTPKFRIA